MPASLTLRLEMAPRICAPRSRSEHTITRQKDHGENGDATGWRERELGRPRPRPFRLEEATIDDLHAAIRAGRTTCVDVVKHYLARIRAFNGVASLLVTADGAPVAPATGTVRAGAPLAFPTETVKAASFIPDLDKYKGPPLEYGRMEPTASDPSVQQQFGMIVGVPDGTQLNALATLNIRGERSVTCRGEFDRHPSLGPLPPGAPPVCEHFRQLPDALERAAELDAAYGRNPDLAEDADVRRRVLVQGPVRHQGHALDRRRRRGLRHRLSGARPRAGRAAAPEGRDHLRQGAVHRVQRPRRRSGRPPQAGQGAAVDARPPAQHLGRQSGQRLRPAPLRLARLELRLRRLGQRQPGDGEPRRGDARLLPRPGQPQRGGADPAAQGDARLRRRRDRRRHLLRPHRHPVPHARRLRQGARRAQGPGGGLLRSARSLHDGAARLGARHALCEPCRRVGSARIARRHPARRHPRVDADPAGLEDRGADRHGGGGRDQARARRAARRLAGRIRPIRCGGPIPRSSR